MMYFFVSMPPKISCMVKPDFSATSMKLAIGVAAVGKAFGCGPIQFATKTRRNEIDAGPRRLQLLVCGMGPERMVGIRGLGVKQARYFRRRFVRRAYRGVATSATPTFLSAAP